MGLISVHGRTNVFATSSAPMQPYPPSMEEQRPLLSEATDHLAQMALCKANTGTRDREVCNLRPRGEVRIPELQTSLFIVPADGGEEGIELHRPQSGKETSRSDVRALGFGEPSSFGGLDPGTLQRYFGKWKRKGLNEITSGLVED